MNKYIPKQLLKIIKPLIFLLIGFLILKIIFEVFIFQTYSNNYIGYQIYKNNQTLFEQTSKEIISFQNNETNFIKNSCSYFNKEKTEFLCKKRLTQELIRDKMKQIGIDCIRLQYGSGGEKYTRVIYQLDKSLFVLNQFTQPILIYSYMEGKKSSSWYLPFPISNKYIYIGSKGLVINSHWLVGGEKKYSGE